MFSLGDLRHKVFFVVAVNIFMKTLGENDVKNIFDLFRSS